MSKKLINKSILRPDEISKHLTAFIARDWQEWKDYDSQLICSIYELKRISDDPFADNSYRVLYDALSTIAEKLKANDYYQ